MNAKEQFEQEFTALCNKSILPWQEKAEILQRVLRSMFVQCRILG